MIRSDDGYLFDDEPITDDPVSAFLQLWERLPESFVANPKLPDSWCRECQWCHEGYVYPEGKPNKYWILYRCNRCGEAMQYITGMERVEWRRQIDPDTGEPIALERGFTDEVDMEVASAE